MGNFNRLFKELESALRPQDRADIFLISDIVQLYNSNQSLYMNLLIRKANGKFKELLQNKIVQRILEKHCIIDEKQFIL